MRLFICATCHEGYDIEISGGIRCPECGGNKWKGINRLPRSASEYRKELAEKYGIMICDDDEDLKKRKLEWVMEPVKGD